MSGLFHLDGIAFRRPTMRGVKDVLQIVSAATGKPKLREREMMRPLLFRPIEDREDRLPGIFMQQKYARLLVLGAISKKIDWNRGASEFRHLQQVRVLEQRDPVRIGSQGRQVIAVFVQSSANC